mmetsp:Transcript_40456/g.75139  ORF Transcript_40456/g.75139 Transcript_40456/m.75139 type:complete len:486 (+) Transcript_40456:103-1560(+)
MAEPRSPILEMAVGSARDARGVADGRYSTLVCSIFMLNMVLGTGPLTLPYAFKQAGLLLGAVFLGVMMSFSFITATFVIEGLAMANRLKCSAGKTLEEGSECSAGAAHSDDSTQESTLSAQQEVQEEIVERFEIGKIAEAVMPPRLRTLSYLVLILYAYGVLTVYVISGCASVAKEVGTIRGIDPYRPLLCCFVLLVSPICLLDFQRTRPLQIFIGIARVATVFLMILVMVRYNWLRPAEETRRKLADIPLWNPAGLPSLFGNAAFTFMIHHSIPGLVFPLRRHQASHRAIACTYVFSYGLYLALCGLALLSFGDVTWEECENTPSHPCEIHGLFNTNFSSADYQWAAKFVVLYPILVVSVFPLVAITLRNNLKAFCGWPSTASSSLDVHNLLFTLLAIGPPFAVATITRDVQVVMKYVGCYFGLGLMFLVPSLIFLYSRRAAADTALGLPSLRAPVGGRAAAWGTLAAFGAAVVFNTVSLAAGD